MSSVVPSPPPCTAAAPLRERPLPGLRAWFVAFVAWMIALAVVFQTMLARYEAGDPVAMRLCLLAGMCFYLTLCNAFVPLPTAWAIMLLASDGVMLFEQAWLRVVVVAGAGALASMLANLNEYHVLSYLSRFGLAERIRRWRVYRWGVRWFDISPLRTLTLIAFVPIPIDAVRWLAILRRYSRVRFGWAYLCGRFPRYALLAGLAVGLRLDQWEIIAIQAGLVVLLGAHLLWRVIQRWGRPAAAATAGVGVMTVAAAVSRDDAPAG